MPNSLSSANFLSSESLKSKGILEYLSPLKKVSDIEFSLILFSLNSFGLVNDAVIKFSVLVGAITTPSKLDLKSIEE